MAGLVARCKLIDPGRSWSARTETSKFKGAAARCERSANDFDRSVADTEQMHVAAALQRQSACWKLTNKTTALGNWLADAVWTGMNCAMIAGPSMKRFVSTNAARSRQISSGELARLAQCRRSDACPSELPAVSSLSPDCMQPDTPSACGRALSLTAPLSPPAAPLSPPAAPLSPPVARGSTSRPPWPPGL